MEQLSQNVVMFGSQEPPTQPVPIRAGNISAFYSGGFLRYIKVHGHELLRMINFMVRDHNWNTVPQRITYEDMAISEEGFNLHFTALAKLDEVKFSWDCHLNGNKDQEITFDITGTALSDFKRNRIGFTVLHPVKECRGQKVRIGHVDGSTAEYEFPELISPHQPFYNIRSMHWRVAETEVSLLFDGEIFETEDQRNWTDESYKTYCTPLALPFPKQLKAGEQVKQKIVLKVSNSDFAKLAGDADTHTFRVSQNGFSLPMIGIGRAKDYTLKTPQISSLSKIDFDHYQADLKMFASDWREQLTSILDEADSLGLHIELSLFFKDTEKELGMLLSALGDEQVGIAMINLFDKDHKTTSYKTIETVTGPLRSKLADVRIGAGTNAFFTELNRERVSHSGLDYLVYSLNPQVHAFDNESLVESLYAQPDTVATAESFSQGLPIHISPITLKMRWNPNTTTSSDEPAHTPDPRQKSIFAAAWLVGSIQNLLTPGVESLTYFETIGPRGLMDVPKGAGLLCYPMFFVFEWLLQLKGQPCYSIKAKERLSFGGIVAGSEMDKLILVNYTGRSLKIQLPDMLTGLNGYFLDATGARDLMNGTVTLLQLPRIAVEQSVQLSPFTIGFFSK